MAANTKANTKANTHWIARAEAALDGGPSDAEIDGVDVLLGQAPPLFDASGRRALVAPLLAVFFWTAATFTEQLRGPLDATGLVLRLLALALSVRSWLLGREFVARARIYLRHQRYRLALATEGLLLRTPEGDIAIETASVIDIREQLGKSKDRSRWAAIYLVTEPSSGRLFVSIPPVFAHSPGLLVEQLTNRLAPQADSQPARAPAAGDAAANRCAFERRRGLSPRGPYATILLGIVLLSGYLRLPATLQAQVGGMVAWVVIACVGIVPAAWLLWTRIRVGPRRGPLLVLSGADLCVSTRSGLERVPWSHVSAIETSVRTLWSLIQGAHEARALTIRRIGDPVIRLSDDQLALPIEVVGALCEACKSGRLS
jgi:hypothetical protein